MLIHSVFFWLKPELTEARRAEFRRGLESLAGISSLQSLHIGTPAPLPPRPVLDATYTFALTGVFQDVAGQTAYQTDPLHLAFLERFRGDWIKVQIYDAA